MIKKIFAGIEIEVVQNKYGGDYGGRVCQTVYEKT